MLSFILKFLIWSIIVPPCIAYGEDQIFPISYTFQGENKGRIYAMGFSPDGKSLAIWHNKYLHVLDSKTGKEVKRILGGPGSLETYNYVLFDSSGRYCCTAELFGYVIRLRFYDIDSGRSSELVVPEDFKPFYDYYGDLEYYLPLRNWLHFSLVSTDAKSGYAVVFPKNEKLPESKLFIKLSNQGDRSTQLADRIFESMFKEESIKEAQQKLLMIGPRFPVALSKNQKTLLVQLKGRKDHLAWYRFLFFDTNSRMKVSEIHVKTGIRWRSGVTRGFAFSPDLTKLARSLHSGKVIVHDIAAIPVRKIDTNKPIMVKINESN